MVSAGALTMFSGKIILNFGTPERLRTLRRSIFTGGVVTGNGSCSAAFCESAALRGYPLRLAALASSPKGTPYGNAGNFIAATKSRPLGEGGLPRSGKTEGVTSAQANFAVLSKTVHPPLKPSPAGEGCA